ncbi:hypothetical protein VTL71DRAFT_11252 [Oculimacula yallundae]|uniref:Uncharacterized protein n=1 Tax=Oculimacula yallundae TaxID=86028 RepID=A0ABR4CWU7_9HELO
MCNHALYKEWNELTHSALPATIQSQKSVPSSNHNTATAIPSSPIPSATAKRKANLCPTLGSPKSIHCKESKLS